jgi:hypothetical protein
MRQLAFLRVRRLPASRPYPLLRPTLYVLRQAQLSGVGFLHARSAELRVPGLGFDTTGLNGWPLDRMCVFFQRLFLRRGALTQTLRGLAAALGVLFQGFLCQRHASLLHLLQGVGGAVQTGRPSRPSTVASLGTPIAMLTQELTLRSFSFLHEAVTHPFLLTTRLSLLLWQQLSVVPQSGELGPKVGHELRPAHALAWVGLSLRLTYRIRYHALDRKIRKIVKNKYRYVRSYVCVREAQRVRYGLRLLPLGVLLCPERRWHSRLGVLLQTLLWHPQQSVVRQLRHQHHQTALGALGLV